MKPALFIGMISGTSRDGVDAALVRFEDGRAEVREAVCIPYPVVLADALHRQALAGKRPGPTLLQELDTQLANHFSDTALQLLEKAGAVKEDVTAIGSHGQTVWHQPNAPDPESIQLGNPRQIARRTGIVTAGDFRSADMAEGGQGAPLAPLLHRALFRPSNGTRVVLNLGGIANISVIDSAGEVCGFDTGPANCLLDAWVRLQRDEPFDRNGDWAAGGRVVSHLLRDMLADPYFKKPAPKSTGIEYFNLSWLERFATRGSSDFRDVQATLAELSAASVAESIRPHHPVDVLVCGGGVHNSDLLQRLQSRLPGCAVRSTADLGLDPDWVEAVLFAWLARERLAGRQQDTRNITGAGKPVLLGTLFEPA